MRTEHPAQRLSRILGILFLLGAAPLNAAPPGLYDDDELSVDLQAAYAVRPRPGRTQYTAQLPRPIRTVDFCPWQAQPADVQQVMRPESGYLCELHVLPAWGELKLQAAARAALASKHEGYTQSTDLREELLGGRKVIRWRYQAGKTRLDHFLVAGRKNDYLFVSSPYGSNGAIEAIISGMRVKSVADQRR